MHVDVCIVGKGLAGSILGYRLCQRGLRVAFIDDASPKASWRVANGLWNAVTFRRLRRPESASAKVEAMERLITEIEEESGESLYRRKPIVRLFADEDYREMWGKRLEDPLVGPHLSDALPAELETLPVCIPHGAGVVSHGGYLNIHAFLRVLHEWLDERTFTLDERFDRDALSLGPPCRYGALTADRMVFAEGYRVLENPLFQWLPMAPCKGQALRLKAPTWELPFILNNGKHLHDVGDGTFDLGSTFEQRPLDHEPTQKGRERLLSDLAKHVAGEFEVVSHVAGIRPTTRDRQPLVGPHPFVPHVFVLNGLGTKGVLNGPWLVERLCDLLMDGTPLPREIDVARAYKYLPQAP